jgi:hypothetical protein
MLMQAKRENDNLYYQRPPQMLPSLQPPQRMVKPILWVLPPIHPCLQELTSLDAFSSVPEDVTPEAGPSVSPHPAAETSSTAPHAAPIPGVTFERAGALKVVSFLPMPRREVPYCLPLQNCRHPWYIKVRVNACPILTVEAYGKGAPQTWIFNFLRDGTVPGILASFSHLDNI